MTTENTPTEETPDPVADAVAAAERELQAIEQSALQEPDAPEHPLGEPAAFHRWERIDGMSVRVPMDQTRESFIEAWRAERAKEQADREATQAEIDAYRAKTPLQRARDYSDAERAALDEMVRPDGSPI